ncbi:MAG: hypothetical protein A3H28_08145 [Acidobacteria bacterium RIFCSPLOWO2_02_FULL_61_28]|nr:MAG: hypothetical protein A3H28_08145 [Acidobacteria bacterium RIFCSPLOWO2_02_FULL_61_28]
MKKSGRKTKDDLQPEYDFAKMPGGVRGKYVQRYRQGTNLALLDRDVAEVFPNDEAVNETLRAVKNAAARLPQRPSHKRRQRAVAR